MFECLYHCGLSQTKFCDKKWSNKTNKIPSLSLRIKSKHNSTRGIEHSNQPLFYNCINPSVTGRWLDWWWTIVFSKTWIMPTESSCKMIIVCAPSAWPKWWALNPIQAKMQRSAVSMTGTRGLQPSTSTSKTNSFSAVSNHLASLLLFLCLNTEDNIQPAEEKSSSLGRAYPRKNLPAQLGRYSLISRFASCRRSLHLRTEYFPCHLPIPLC